MAKNVLLISYESLNESGIGGMGKVLYHLGNELYPKNKVTLLIPSKGKFDTEFDSQSAITPIRVFLIILHVLNKNLSFISKAWYRYITEILFDISCWHLVRNKNFEILITTNPFLRFTLKRLKAKGTILILLPPNPEENLIRSKILEESKKIKMGI